MSPHCPLMVNVFDTAEAATDWMRQQRFVKDSHGVPIVRISLGTEGRILVLAQVEEEAMRPSPIKGIGAWLSDGRCVFFSTDIQSEVETMMCRAFPEEGNRYSLFHAEVAIEGTDTDSQGDRRLPVGYETAFVAFLRKEEEGLSRVKRLHIEGMDDPIPEDAMILRARVDQGSLDIILRSDTFDPVSYGDSIPEMS